jgi:uncharacterized protein YjbI with pentapeptide repeats
MSHFERVDLTNATFRHVNMAGARFEGVNLADVVMRGVEMVDMNWWPPAPFRTVMISASDGRAERSRGTPSRSRI